MDSSGKQEVSFGVVDLTGVPATPRAAIEVQRERVYARRGVDIVLFATQAWRVCMVCDLPCSVVCEMSACCGGPARVQGWSR